MRVLVCGSRDWTDQRMVDVVLDGLYDQTSWLDVVVLIHGAARGADSCAATWAQDRDWCDDERPYPADWDKYGKAAGAIRNELMLKEGKPELVIAFKDGYGAERHPNGNLKGGTEHMVTIATRAGVPVWLMSHG